MRLKPCRLPFILPSPASAPAWTEMYYRSGTGSHQRVTVLFLLDILCHDSLQASRAAANVSRAAAEASRAAAEASRPVANASELVTGSIL